jgi:hypothetical protein
VEAVAFAPDGRTLATASSDTTALVWRTFGGTPPRPAAAPAEDPDRLWATLAGDDAAKAYEAAGVLAAAPEQAVPVLAERLPPAPAVPLRAAQWLADLDSEQFKVREKATAELEALGEQAEPGLRRILRGSPSPELRRRAEALLEKLERRGPSPDRLRALRAVEVLEQIGTSRARRVLQALAQGAPEALLTLEAKASLQRLAKQGAPTP